MRKNSIALHTISSREAAVSVESNFTPMSNSYYV